MLISRRHDQQGTVVVGSLFAMVFLLTLLLGTVQIVFTLYSRNVIQAAAYEGVRSAIERGASDTAATSAARAAVTRAAGGLLARLDVFVERSPMRDGTLVRVEVVGRLRPVGPLPMHLPVSAVAHSVAVGEPR